MKYKVLVLSNKYGNGTLKLFNNIQNRIHNVEINRSFYKDIIIKIDTKNLFNPVTVGINGIDILEYDLVIFRNWMKTNRKEIVYSLAKYLSFHKIRFIDGYANAVEYDYKLFQYTILALNKFKVPKSIFLSTESLINSYSTLQEFIGSQFIIKRSNADKGGDNYFIKSIKEFKKIVKNFDPGDIFICQEFIPNNSDYRILTTDFKVSSAELRVRESKEDHRNNASLGAKEVFLDIKSLPDNIIKISEDVSKLFNINLCGVDLVKDSRSGELYLLEANSVPGITLGSTEEDAVINYIKSICDSDIFSIKKAIKADAVTLMGIRRSARYVGYPKFISNLTLKDLQNENEDVGKFISYFEKVVKEDNYSCYKAIDKYGKAVGFVITRRKERIGFIDMLFISPEHQNKGLGSKLMHKALLEFQGSEKIELKVLKGNKAAIFLYQKFGFKISNEPISDIHINNVNLPRLKMTLELSK